LIKKKPDDNTQGKENVWAAKIDENLSKEETRATSLQGTDAQDVKGYVKQRGTTTVEIQGKENRDGPDKSRSPASQLHAKRW